VEVVSALRISFNVYSVYYCLRAVRKYSSNTTEGDLGAIKKERVFDTLSLS
jgi:hypothetical protein